MFMVPTSQQIAGEGNKGQYPISLVIPCKAEYVGLCRLVAGIVGARESLDEELIADLKLVVTEACTCFIWGADRTPAGEDGSPASESPGSIRVDFDVMPEAWDITISDPDHHRHIALSDRCNPMSDDGLGLAIIKALVDSLEQTDSDAEGSVLRLVKRLPRGSESAS